MNNKQLWGIITKYVCARDMTGLNYYKEDILKSLNEHQLPPVSQSAGVWVKASERLPEFVNREKKYVVRYEKIPDELELWNWDSINERQAAGYTFEYLDESPVSQPQPQQGNENKVLIGKCPPAQQGNVDDEYPTEEQIGGGKQWDLMTELEQTYYKLMKCKNALAVSTNTVKRLREGASPLPDWKQKLADHFRYRSFEEMDTREQSIANWLFDNGFILHPA